jgi:tripartite-type tricarboxylate transporter receptor subunit TctC
MEALPDVPTVGEFIPGSEASNVNGVGVPTKTPADIVAKLNCFKSRAFDRAAGFLPPRP